MFFDGQLPAKSTALLPLLVNLRVVFPIDSTYPLGLGPTIKIQNNP